MTSLLSFNLGVELGQLAVLLLMVPALDLIFRFGIQEKMGTILLSALVAHTGWHWMSDRAGQLVQYTFRWPVFDLGFLARTLALLAVTLALAAATWVAIGWVRRPGAEGAEPEIMAGDPAA